MDRIKRLSMQVLDEHKSRFGLNFADNKKVLDQICEIRSKGLKNEIAGYITKLIKHELLDKQMREEQSKRQDVETSGTIEITEEQADENSITIEETTEEPTEEPATEESQTN